jgi:hypothetical protein
MDSCKNRCGRWVDCMWTVTVDVRLRFMRCVERESGLIWPHYCYYEDEHVSWQFAAQ